MQRGSALIRGGLARVSRGCPVHVAPSTSAFRGSSGSLKSLRFPSRGAMTEEAGDAAGADPEKKWTKRDLRHTSAVVICPPSSQWGPIQEIRSVNDKSYARWMPHINLLYPFLLDDDGDEAPRRNFDAATAVAREALRGIEPFTVTLRTFSRFEHAKSCTVWLHPSEPPLEGNDPARGSDLGNADVDAGPRDAVSRGIVRTQAALERAFPFADHLSAISPHSGYVPHLSVGQYDDVASARVAELALRDAWEPVTFEVDAVYVISRAGADAPFEFKARVPLGAAGGAWRRGDVEVEDGSLGGGWWTDAYDPPPPPEGARCLRPRPKRRWKGKRRGKGGGGGRGDGAP